MVAVWCSVVEAWLVMGPATVSVAPVMPVPIVTVLAVTSSVAIVWSAESSSW